MFSKVTLASMIANSSAHEADRRLFLRSAAAAGMGAVTFGTLEGIQPADAVGLSDATVLNFALNLEYLESEFYQRAVYGRPLAAGLTSGTGKEGTVTGGRQVNFKSPAIRMAAQEIANDELDHVKFLRKTLGSAHIARPSIDIDTTFTKIARSTGLVGPTGNFDAYANEDNFMVAALLFEDNGVSAYKGAAPLIHNKTYLEASAGILAVEAYHAAILRTNLFAAGRTAVVNHFSDAKDAVDGSSDDDQGLGRRGMGRKGGANLVPTDGNSIAFSRTADRVLNVVYVTPKKATSGGFFPEGVNGGIRTSGGNG